jgi:hypothetical protein
MKGWIYPLAAAAILLSACASRPETAPAPGRAPPVRSAPEPAPTPEPESAERGGQDSPDPPLSPGDWSYSSAEGGSVARFGAAGTETFSLRCDTGSRRISLTRAGSSARLKVRTSYGERALAPASGLGADDALLDEIAFSRGRFTVETDGLQPLILPAWPEPARVIDDCRG